MHVDDGAGRETLLVPLPDAGRLAVHLTSGPGGPLVCVPGGPLLGARYLGDLGGLGGQRRLALVDSRGAGGSDAPHDVSGYRCDRLVADLDAVRCHLGLAAMDLLAHSAGANLAYRYAERFPGRLRSLALITPSPFGVGVDVTLEQRRAVLAARVGEPWQPAAVEALASIVAGTAGDDDWAALTPGSHGRWDAEEAAFAAWMDRERRPEAVAAFAGPGAFDPAAARVALAGSQLPVLVLAGEHDVGNPPPAMAAIAELSPRARFFCQPGAGHFPWRDDAEAFVSAVCGWLAEQG